jgi:hypothetical protein
MTFLVSAQTTAIKADDASDDEFGIWWINLYDSDPFGLNNLDYADDEADAFSTKMIAEGYSRNFRCTNNNARENHFENSGDGGDDTYYADACDFFYFCGHGAEYRFYFNQDYDGDDIYTYQVRANNSDVDNEPIWGDTDLEWAFIHACECLKSSYKTEWNDAFEGLHGICGFDTEAGARPNGPTGNWTAYYLTDGGYDIHDAWREATKKCQLTTRDGAIYRARIRIDTTYYDYGDEFIDNMLPDYGDVGVYFVSFLYSEWDCEWTGS